MGAILGAVFGATFFAIESDLESIIAMLVAIFRKLAGSSLTETGSDQGEREDRAGGHGRPEAVRDGGDGAEEQEVELRLL